MTMKKIAALLLALCLICSVFAACGGNKGTTSESTTSTTSTSSTSTADTDTDADADTDTEPATDEEWTWDSENISWKLDTSPCTIECYIDYNWYSVDKWGADDVSKYIESETGISLDVTKASDNNQLMVLLASDSLPEMMFEDNQHTRFFDGNYCYSFDELIDEYCPEFRELLNPVEILNNTYEGGGTMWSLRSHAYFPEDLTDNRLQFSTGDAGLYVRSDIMEQLGNPALESVEDFMDILAQVKEQFPDLIPYLPHPTWTSPFCYVYGFTSPTAISWHPGEDNCYLGMSDPNFHDWFKYQNELVTNGYVSIEYRTYEPEQFFQINRSGAAFACSYNTGEADAANKVFDEQGIEAHYVPVMTRLTHDGKDDFQELYYSTGWAYTFISKNCKNPDRAIKYMEYLKSPHGQQTTMWGIEGTHWDWQADDQGREFPVMHEEYIGVPGSETGIGPWYFMVHGILEGISGGRGRLSDPTYSQGCDLRDFLAAQYVVNPALNFTTPPADTDEYVIKTKLGDLWTNTCADVYTATDFEAAYDNFMQQAEDIGLSTLNEYMTNAYQEAQKFYADNGISF